MGARTIQFPSHPAERLRGMRRGRGAAFWRAAALLFGGLIVLFLLLGDTQSGVLFWPVVLFLLCFVAWMRSRAYPLGDADERAALAAGVDGERAVARRLAKRLPRGYVVLNGLHVPGAGDLDHVVVGPSGLFVVETKNLAGAIRRGPDGWRRVKSGRRGGAYDAWIGDPDAQLDRAIRTLRGHLELVAPGLLGSFDLKIGGLIVFPNRDAWLDVAPGGFPAVRPDEAAKLIAAHEPQRRLEPWEVDEVVEALRKEPPRQGILFPS